MIYLRQFWMELVRRNRLLAYAAGANLLIFILLIPAMLLDPMQILGISRWIKPMKFAISIAIYLGTIGWLLAYLTERVRAAKIIGRIAAFTMFFEMILILTQATRGQQSHFNHTSAFNDMVFSAMGILIVINTVAIIYAAFLFYSSPVALPPAHLAGIRTGFVVFILASLEAGLMVGHDSHSVGIHDGGPGLPLVNWSTTAGDLRIAHFFGMHALQALPIVGWALDRLQAKNGKTLVWIVAAAWVLIMGLLVRQALAGHPLFRM